MNVLRTRRRGRPAAPARRGSVLVVVLALLAALMLLGFLFYTVASQERENARYFTASEKWYSAQLDPDTLFDFALEQVIVGPQDDYANSALWGGRYSLLASLVGDDLQPYSGAGVNVVDAGQLVGTPDGVPTVDQDQNGVADPPAGGDSNGDSVDDVDADGDGIHDNLSLNLAWIAATTGLTDLRFQFAKPDVGYSYADLNSPFLAYVGREPMTGATVVIPSFHRPQYLRGLFNNPPSSPTVPPDQWYTDPRTGPLVLRPHAAKNVLEFDYSTGTIVDTGVPRYTDAELIRRTTAPAFDEGFWTWTGTGSPPNEFDVDADGDPANGREAVALDLDHPVEETPDGAQKFIPIYGITIYDLDGLLNLNAHGNVYGVPENLASIPVNPFQFLSQSNEGRRPYEINPQMGLDAPPSTSGPEHSDFFGFAPTTATQLANMEWWFLTSGRADFDSSTGAIDRLHPGRWGVEAQRLEDAITNDRANPYAYPQPGDPFNDGGVGSVPDATRGMAFGGDGGLFPPGVLFPRPAHPEDHRGNGTFVALDGKTPLVRAIAGPGRVSTLAYLNYWFPQAPNANLNPAPLWSLAQSISGFNPPIVTWLALTGRIAAFTTAGTGASPFLLVDDPGETLLDPEQARDQVTDSIFPPEETAFLHLPGTNPAVDFNVVSRLLELAPANFTTDVPGGSLAVDRRKRFTTVSADLNAYSAAPERLRPWETRPDAPFDSAIYGVFPPAFGPIATPVDPFRPEARGLLQQVERTLVTQTPPTYQSDHLKRLVRKLSVNHVAAAQGGRYILRPVMPHPLPGGASPGLSNDPIPVPALNDPQKNPLTPGATGPSGRPFFGVSDQVLAANGLTTNAIANPNVLTAVGFVTPGGQPWPEAAQEWYARRDRQNLARDIYTLLYLLSDPDATPTTNPVLTPNDLSRLVYSEAQLAEMAQFAVNLVDAMDPDDTITAFVYDKDLADGYTPLDDAHGSLDPSGPNPVPYNAVTGRYEDPVRGIVFGVEAQKLAIGEALAVFAHRYEQGGVPGDHYATEWNDQFHNDFAYVELQNMTPAAVPLNGGWSIVCESDFAPATTGVAVPRTLTILDGGDAPPGGAYTIGAAGDGRNVDPNTGLPRPSHVMVDPNSGSNGPAPPPYPPYLQIAPAVPGSTLDFDAITANAADYRVNNYDPLNRSKDGPPVLDDTDDPAPYGPPSPAGGQWLYLGPQNDRAAIVGGSYNVTFRLRRRLNLDRAMPLQDGTPADDARQFDNPWIEVDAATVPLRVFNLSGTTAAADVQTQLRDQIASSIRTEPLNRMSLVPTDTSREVGQYQKNTLGGYSASESALPAAALWQRHYDRWFGSLADVLHVPLYGPGEVTAQLTIASQTANVSSVADRSSIAAARFLFPDQDLRQLGPPATPPNDYVWPIGNPSNLWYRLFEFVEVPQKYGDNDGLSWFAHAAGPAPWGGRRENLRLRNFGKINLNTLRDPHVLAGLLDDADVFQFTPFAAGSPTGYLPSAGTNGSVGSNNELWLDPATGPGRDWWTAVLASRDGGFDPYSATHFGGTQLILPGVPSAKPFLPFGGATGMAGTLPESFARSFLRPMPDGTLTPPDLDGFEAGQGRRSLFELGNEIPGATGNQIGSDAAFETRYRLLGKVLNHGTTRSNTYVAFMTCDFYEANGVDHDGDPATPEVFQVGPKMPADTNNPDEPRYRGVFVIDRSLALQMLQRRDLPPNDQNLVYPQGSVYRTYSFAREAGADGRPKPTLDWRDLVLYRRITKAQ